MTKPEFYNLLDELMELDPGTIKGDERLVDIPQWDSLAIIGFIALIDQHFGISVAATRITSCENIAEVVAIVEDRIT